MLVVPVPPFLYNLAQFYSTCLHHYTVLTQALTTATLACLGDAIAQQQQNTRYDTGRGMTFFLWGAVYTGVFQHVWFAYLSAHVQAAFAVMDQESVLMDNYIHMKIALVQVLLNQFVIVPILYVPLFLFVTSNFGVHAAWQRARAMYWTLLWRNYAFWLPVQWLEFCCIHQEWQIPFQSVAALVWTTVLSLTSNSNTNRKAKGSTREYDASHRRPRRRRDKKLDAVTETQKDAALLLTTAGSAAAAVQTNRRRKRIKPNTMGSMILDALLWNTTTTTSSSIKNNNKEDAEQEGSPEALVNMRRSNRRPPRWRHCGVANQDGYRRGATTTSYSSSRTTALTSTSDHQSWTRHTRQEGAWLPLYQSRSMHDFLEKSNGKATAFTQRKCVSFGHF